MKTILKSITLFMAILLLGYLAFSFVIWDLNPANWSKGTRVACVWIFGCIGAVLSFSHYFNNKYI
jgi:hypothetical protein